MLAVRADFYGRCAAYPGLSQLLGANHVLVGPMSRDELGRAIERPAQRVGLSVEPELVESLLADVEGQPGALPLLSTALLELWRERDGRRLRLAAYARSGGVHGAVARLAEDAFVGLDPEQQAIARKLLLRLADEDESGAVVRRRVALADLATGGRESPRSSSGSPTAACSRSPTAPSRSRTRRSCASGRGCAAWLAEDADGRRLHRRLGDAARAWDADARDPGELYRGARLAAALDWAAGHGAELSPTERAFLDDSRSASGRAQRRLRMMLAGVAALLVLAVIAGVVALDQRGDARAEATTAAAQRLGAQALADASLDRGAAARPPGRGAGRLACRPAATSSPRCSRAPPRSACSAATATRWRASTSARDGRTLALPGHRRDAGPRRPRPPGARRCRDGRSPASSGARRGVDVVTLQRRRLAARGRRVAARRPRRRERSRRDVAA